MKEYTDYIRKGIVMKYAFNLEKNDYQTITYSSQIHFENDIIYFKSIIDAYKHLYYAKDNVFEVEVSKSVIRHLKLLKILMIHNVNLKLKLSDTTFINVCCYIFLIPVSQFFKVFTKKRDFEPALKTYNLNNKTLYILDNYAINDFNFDFKGEAINATYDPQSLPIPFQVLDEKVDIQFVNDEDLLGSSFKKHNYSIFENKIVKCVTYPKVHIYNVTKENDKIVLSIFFQGYQHYDYSFAIVSENKYNILPNDDWKYYSKKSMKFKQNFCKLELETYQDDIGFKYEDTAAKVFFTRHLTSGVIYNNLVLRVKNYTVTIDTNINKYKDNYYLEIEKKKKERSRCQIYLFQDRIDSADDNAEALYRYYQKNSNKKIYFALSKNSKCWNRLQTEGFNLVDFGSNEHKEIYLCATKVISSHATRRIYDPFFPKRDYVNLESFAFVFLQHGIIMGKHHGFLDIVNNKIDLIISSNEDEQKIIKSFSGFEKIAITGLARYDNYKQESINKSTEKFIVYAPSWNVKYRDNLNNSDYKLEIEKVLTSKIINEKLTNADCSLKLIFHPEFINKNIRVNNPFGYEILKQGDFLYSDVLANCSGLITDYSSLFFDVLFQKKFVIQHKPYELHHENKVLRGYQDAIYESFDISKLEATIEQIYVNNFQLDKTKKEIINNFFLYNDNNFCLRNFNEIENISTIDVVKKECNPK